MTQYAVLFLIIRVAARVLSTDNANNNCTGLQTGVLCKGKPQVSVNYVAKNLQDLPSNSLANLRTSGKQSW